jgi:hypothetical protein
MDELGEWPIFVGDVEPLPPGPGVRYRYVARVETRELALAMIVRLHARRAPEGAGEEGPTPS